MRNDEIEVFDSYCMMIIKGIIDKKEDGKVGHLYEIDDAIVLAEYIMEVRREAISK
jgi:hypothetical protein